jgi:hypothetical protein
LVRRRLCCRRFADPNRPSTPGNQRSSHTDACRCGDRIGCGWERASRHLGDPCRITPPGATSLTRSLTRSHARSFASNAQLKRAKSRYRRAVLSSWRIAQICFGLSGAFGPTMRPAFQGLRGIRNRSGCLIAASVEAPSQERFGGPLAPPEAALDHARSRRFGSF